MKPRHLILLLLRSRGGNISTKTRLQKEMYFASLLMKHDLQYKAHYFGPFSPSVEEALNEAVGAGFVDMNTTRYGSRGSHGFETKRFDYTLTEAGEAFAEILAKRHTKESKTIEKMVEDLSAVGNPDYLSLSVAAKAYFILHQEGQALDEKQIASRARGFGWNVGTNDIEKATEILLRLGYVTKQ